MAPTSGEAARRAPPATSGAAATEDGSLDEGDADGSERLLITPGVSVVDWPEGLAGHPGRTASNDGLRDERPSVGAAGRMRRHGRHRASGAVVSGTAENDVQAVLRFYGWIRHTDRLPDEGVAGLALVFVRADLGDLVEAYCTWLAEQQGLRFSSIANYVNSLLSIAQHCHATYEVPEATLALEPSPQPRR